MVSTSKILTVSYGTFSCTLEGFDEPFNTMKSIAEYFRDLAADDRYFGAEPPTPDAEMLHRIAEREIQKRVEARIENDEVVLRQADAAAPRIKPAAATLIPGETLLQDEGPAEDVAQAPVKTAEPVEVELVKAAPVAEFAAAEPEEGPIAEPVGIPASDSSADSLAAKLQRIRAVVDRGHEDDEDYVEDQQADSFFGEPAPVAPEPAVAETPVSQPAPAPLMFAETEFADAAPVMEEKAAAPVEEAPADDWAEDLAEEVEDEAAFTDEDAEADEARSLAAVMGAVAAEAPVADSYDEDEFNVVEELAEEDDPISSVLGGLGPDTAVDEAEAEAEAEAQDVAEDEADFDAEDADLEEQDIALGDDLDDDEAFAQEEFADRAEDDEDENVFAESEAEDEAADIPEPVQLRRPIARVVKVKRADVEPARAEAESQDNEDSMLTPEDEAELMAELAQVERDFPASEDAEETDIGEEAPEDATTAFDEPGFDESGAAVDRILAETNVKMDSSEVSRRRSAIAHLKAAVQATRADKAAGKALPSHDETEDYRDDLAHVVRPRRPEGDAQGKPRRLAPLMLVSEQRIDTPAPERVTPASVRPRRITKGNLALRDDLEDAIAQGAPRAVPTAQDDVSIDFDSFARQKGATDMGELLEAAAAHAIFIEGRPHFSRPQVMKLALGHDPAAGHSREDGLRAFGKLLREGRIRKIKRGQFVLDEATRFHPDENRESA